MNRKVVVRLKDVSKVYDVNNGSGGKFYALKDINLVVKSGDRIGIIGNNGAGKSTLLKIISNITKPSLGSIEINGKVASLMSLEAGFKYDLTGRENILLNGLLVGMNNLEIKKKTEEIIKYSGLKNFIEQPFYKYSAGMKFRLAFSIAIKSKCDILVIDEIFMSSDFKFQKKIFKFLKNLNTTNKNMTVIISSHIPDFLWAFSNRYCFLNNGYLKYLNKQQMLKILKKRDLEWKKLLNLVDILR